MEADFFRANQRIQRMGPASLPFRMAVGNFRHYNFWVDFNEKEHLDGLREVLTSVIQEDRRAQRACYRLFEKQGIAADIQQFQTRRKLKRGYPPDYVDLFYLYTHVRTHRPRRVLEYGSGVSTLVMALALEKNGEGRLVSLEPSAEWARLTQACLPERLRAIAEVIYSAGVACELDGRQTVRFAEQPLKDPDMVYIDGAPEGSCYAGAENIELLEEGLVGNGAAIFIDGRRQALNYFNNPLRSSRYKVECAAVDVVNTGTGQRHYSPFGFDQFSNARILCIA